MIQYSLQQTRALQECQQLKALATNFVSILSFLCQIFADCMFVEHWTRVLQVHPRFRLCNSFNFIFEMLYRENEKCKFNDCNDEAGNRGTWPRNCINIK